MPHIKGHLKKAMDSIPAKNNIIKKLDSMYGVNAQGFPYRRDTKTMLPPDNSKFLKSALTEAVGGMAAMATKTKKKKKPKFKKGK